MKRDGPEFDQFAKNYASAVSHPIRKLLESGGENEFLRFKAKWLQDWWLSQQQDKGQKATLLDYGCGTGLLSKYLRELKGDPPTFEAIFGADVSPEMVEVAKPNFSDGHVRLLEPGRETFRGKSFDIVVLSGVLHHIPQEQWPSAFENVRELLKPSGQIVVFEHNPWNPLTQAVVRTTLVDRDAVLATSCRVQRSFAASGFEVRGRRYLHFLPPKWRLTTGVERWLGGWCPLGSQYAIWARPQG